MRRLALAITTFVTLLPLPVAAIDDLVGGSASDGNVSIFASTTPIVNSGSSGGVRCTWNRLTRGEVSTIGGGQDVGALTPEEAAEVAISEVHGVLYEVYAVSCPGSSTELRLIDPSITAADLIGAVTDEVRRAIPEPQHTINPPPEAGSFVNLGLWLAVASQELSPITAEAGPAWITARPELTDVNFDMGNGDLVECDGLGEPYPEGANDPDPGPCGYTYLARLPGDAAYTITVTTTWNISYTSSSGPGSLAPIDSSTSFSYDVDEVQTVGTG